MAIDLDDLRDSKEFLNLIFDNMGAAVLIADEDLQIHQFNRPADGSVETLNLRGTVIGAGGGVHYTQQQVRLVPGDKVLLYTDGVLENRGPAGEAFGRARFDRALQHAAHLPVEEFVPALHGEVRAFLGNARPDDDISLLGLEYTGRDVEPYTI